LVSRPFLFFGDTPSTTDGAVVITPGQLGYLLEGIDWRHPQHT
jgi:transposase